MMSLFILTQRSSKIQSYYQMLDMELGIFFGQILFYEVKIPSNETFSTLDVNDGLQDGFKHNENVISLEDDLV